MTTQKPKSIGMRRFGRIKTLTEVASTCNRRKWKLDLGPLEKGFDHVKIRFKIKTRGSSVSGNALWNVVSGRIFGQLDSGEEFSSDKTEHEQIHWFNVLLDSVYFTTL